MSKIIFLDEARKRRGACTCGFSLAALESLALHVGLSGAVAADVQVNAAVLVFRCMCGKQTSLVADGKGGWVMEDGDARPPVEQEGRER